MSHITGWTMFRCGHNVRTVFPTLQHLKVHQKREYIAFDRGVDGRTYQATAPRPCRRCFGKEFRKAEQKGEQNWVEIWMTEWAGEVASDVDVETDQSRLKPLLHQICPHLRSVENFKEETFIKRVNSQLSLEGISISDNACPGKLDYGTRQKVTQVVEDQLQMHRNSKLKVAAALRESLLYEARIAKRSSQSPKLIQFGSKRAVMV